MGVNAEFSKFPAKRGKTVTIMTNYPKSSMSSFANWFTVESATAFFLKNYCMQLTNLFTKQIINQWPFSLKHWKVFLKKLSNCNFEIYLDESCFFTSTTTGLDPLVFLIGI